MRMDHSIISLKRVVLTTYHCWHCFSRLERWTSVFAVDHRRSLFTASQWSSLNYLIVRWFDFDSLAMALDAPVSLSCLTWSWTGSTKGCERSILPPRWNICGINEQRWWRKKWADNGSWRQHINVPLNLGTIRVCLRCGCRRSELFAQCHLAITQNNQSMNSISPTSIESFSVIASIKELLRKSNKNINAPPMKAVSTPYRSRSKPLETSLVYKKRPLIGWPRCHYLRKGTGWAPRWWVSHRAIRESQKWSADIVDYNCLWSLQLMLKRYYETRPTAIITERVRKASPLFEELSYSPAKVETGRILRRYYQRFDWCRRWLSSALALLLSHEYQDHIYSIRWRRIY